MNHSNLVTCRVRVIIAARGHIVFFEKMEQVLRMASTTQNPITVEDWYDVVAAGNMHIDYCGVFIGSEELVTDYEAESLAQKFSEILSDMTQASPLSTVETVLLFHDSEVELAGTACMNMKVDAEEMLDLSPGVPYSFCSLATSHKQVMRYNRMVGRVHSHAAAVEKARAIGTVSDSTISYGPRTVVKTSWLALIAEPDADVAKDLRTHLVNKAGRQNIHLRVEIRHTVVDAIRAMQATPPFAISLAPHFFKEWDGLEIIGVAKELGVPAVLRSSRSEREVRLALKQLHVEAKPKKVVGESLILPWSDAMLECLMSDTKH